MADLTASELRSLVTVMRETAGLPDLPTFREQMFACLNESLDLPLVALNVRLNGPALVAQSRDLDSVELLERHPEVVAEQVAFLDSPVGSEVFCLGEVIPDEVMDSMATIHEIWLPNGIRDGVTGTLCGPSGVRGYMTMLVDERRRMTRLRLIMQELAPYLERTLDHFAYLDRMSVKLSCLEEVTRMASPALLISAEGRVEWVSQAARELFEELIGSEEVPTAVLARYAVVKRHDRTDVSGAPVLNDGACVQVAGRWLLVRTKHLQGVDCDLLTIEDPARRHTERLRERFSQLGLTQREQEVARQLVDGRLNKEISRSLGISIWTVKNHVKQIYGRTGARNRTDFVRMLLDEHPD